MERNNLVSLSKYIVNYICSYPAPLARTLRAFSCAWRRLHAFVSRFDWFIVLSASFVIGQSGKFGFGFTTLI